MLVGANFFLKYMQVFILVIFISALLFVIKIIRERRKYNAWVSYLNEKYQNEDIVNSILMGEFWKGQSVDQLIDSLGRPASIDKQVMKTKIKETWKYKEYRKDQYRIKINLENDVVVGWDIKNNS